MVRTKAEERRLGSCFAPCRATRATPRPSWWVGHGEADSGISGRSFRPGPRALGLELSGPESKFTQ